MSTFLELTERRQSDRAFDPEKAIDHEVIVRILEAARLAPSACNSQPWRMVVVTERELIDQVADCTSDKLLNMNHFTKQAAAHILLVEEPANLSSTIGSWTKGKQFPHIDIGILAEHIALAAADEGVGSCIVGWFDERRLKSLLNIPRSKRILLDVILGYSTQPLRPKQRKPLEEVVSFNKYR